MNPEICGKSIPIYHWENGKVLYYICQLDRSHPKFTYKDGRCRNDCNGNTKQ